MSSTMKIVFFCEISMVVLVTFSLTVGVRSSPTIANAQASSCYNGVIMPSTSNHVIPVILIHGFNENSGIWSKWKQLLSNDAIPFCTVTFHIDDEYGTAVDHARELS